MYRILFNPHDKPRRVIVTLPISVTRKLRVTGVKQLPQSYTFNRANIAYIFCCPGQCSYHSCFKVKKEALSVGWNVLGAGFWGGGIGTGSWLNYRLWPDSGRRHGYSWPGRISTTKTAGWEGVFGRLCVDCFGWRGEFIHVIRWHPAKEKRQWRLRLPWPWFGSFRNLC